MYMEYMKWKNPKVSIESTKNPCVTVVHAHMYYVK